MKCAICDSLSIARHLTTASGLIMKCGECGHVFLSSMNQPAELKGLYSKNYFIERRDYFYRDGIFDCSGIESPHIRDFREGLDWIESFKRPPGRILDIGCAMGSFLSLALEKGWEGYGVEISDYASSLARKRLRADIFTGRIADARYPDDFFDVITMWDLIEHLPDPLEILKEARRVLKDDGILLVNTPNEQSLMRKLSRWLYRGSSGIIRFPVNRLYHGYHLSYFSAGTLSLLFEKSRFAIISQRRKVIPITRGRGSPSVKALVRALSMAEKLFHSEYELFFIVRKHL